MRFWFSENNSGRKGFGRLGGLGCVKCWLVHNSDHELQGNHELLTSKILAFVLANGFLKLQTCFDGRLPVCLISGRDKQRAKYTRVILKTREARGGPVIKRNKRQNEKFMVKICDNGF